MTGDMSSDGGEFVRDPYVDLPPAERISQLACDLHDARTRLEELQSLLTPGAEAGRHFVAAQPEIDRLAHEADRQRPYWLAVEDGWERLSDAEEANLDARRHFHTLLTRIEQDRTDGGETAVPWLDSQLSEAARAIGDAESRRDQATSDLAAASETLLDQVGLGGLITHDDVDKARNDAMDLDYIERNLARERVEAIEGQLLRANGTLQRSSPGSELIEGHPFAHAASRTFGAESGHAHEWER
ncbi:hypothetical protein [Antrihabitans stalactiti]|jgi:chemotaxis regulatin CheY-phosphate phosphatase CheZ|uniref:Uncharacterized protein n=1 Tax=Antrihabitans stalactiti TaxID=2584121 RepID=A0A848KUV1_9NOCA|nr:hypothetical protein [Antrihabitans stalactiti]NMN99287.1 hypothetical protein [Antrihabitans stalactiti]